MRTEIDGMKSEIESRVESWLRRMTKGRDNKADGHGRGSELRKMVLVEEG